MECSKGYCCLSLNKQVFEKVRYIYYTKHFYNKRCYTDLRSCCDVICSESISDIEFICPIYNTESKIGLSLYLTIIIYSYRKIYYERSLTIRGLIVTNWSKYLKIFVTTVFIICSIYFVYRIMWIYPRFDSEILFKFITVIHHRHL